MTLSRIINHPDFGILFFRPKMAKKKKKERKKSKCSLITVLTHEFVALNIDKGINAWIYYYSIDISPTKFQLGSHLIMVL